MDVIHKGTMAIELKQFRADTLDRALGKSQFADRIEDPVEFFDINPDRCRRALEERVLGLLLQRDRGLCRRARYARSRRCRPGLHQHVKGIS